MPTQPSTTSVTTSNDKLVQLVNRLEEANIKAVESLPEHLKKANYRIIQQIKKVEKPNQLPFLYYLSLVYDYVESGKLTVSELMLVLHYLLIEFESKDLTDFPHSFIQTTESKLSALVLKTVSLPDDHPFKWTDKRIQTLKSFNNPYNQLVFFDDYMYLWYKFIAGKDLFTITEADVRVKYILDRLLSRYCIINGTDGLVFKKMSDKEFRRLNILFTCIRRILTKEPTYFSDCAFFPPGQVRNQYIQTGAISLAADSIFSLTGKYTAPAGELIQKLLEKGVLKKVHVLDGFKISEEV